MAFALSGQVLTATPRLRLPVLQGADVQLDALIGGASIQENSFQNALNPAPTGHRNGGADEAGCDRAAAMQPLHSRRLWWSPMAAAASPLGSRQDSPPVGAPRVPSSWVPIAGRRVPLIRALRLLGTVSPYLMAGRSDCCMNRQMVAAFYAFTQTTNGVSRFLPSCLHWRAG